MDKYLLDDGGCAVINYGPKRDVVHKVVLFNAEGKYSVIMQD